MTLLAIIAAVITAGIVIGGIGFAGVMLALAGGGGGSAVLRLHPQTQGAAARRADGRATPARWSRAQNCGSKPSGPPCPRPRRGSSISWACSSMRWGCSCRGSTPRIRRWPKCASWWANIFPETIDNYRKIPAQLRKEAHAGKTADERLTESLSKLSGEVDRVTRRLAEGALDDLAIKSRYLEYRYGGAEALEDMRGAAPDTGVPLPDLAATPKTGQGR